MSAGEDAPFYRAWTQALNQAGTKADLYTISEELNKHLEQEN